MCLITVAGFGCRPKLPEAGVPASIYAQKRLTMGTNPLGEWFVVFGDRGHKVELSSIRFVRVRYGKQHKLFYARQFGPRSLEVLPISPVQDKWLRAAAASKKTRYAFHQTFKSIERIDDLSDPVGVYQAGRVKWMGAVREGRFMGTLWRKDLPKKAEETILSNVIEYNIQLVVDKSLQTPKGTISTFGERTAFKAWAQYLVVLEGAQPTKKIKIAVTGPDGLNLVRGLSSLVDVHAAKTDLSRFAQNQKQVRWTLETLGSQNKADWLIERKDKRTTLLLLRQHNAHRTVHQLMEPALLYEPVQFGEQVDINQMVLGFYALNHGLPLMAGRLLDPASMRIQGVGSGDWIWTELMGQANRTIWMRKQMHHGQTNWAASDRLYNARGYLLDGSPERAQTEAIAAFEEFKKWSYTSGWLGQARALEVLMLAKGALGQLKKAIEYGRAASKIYIALEDELHAAQVQWQAAQIAFDGGAHDEALDFAKKARSRFYYGNAQGATAQVEMMLANMYLELDKPLLARRMADMAVARTKFLDNPVGINQARIVSLLVDDRLDPMRSPNFELEQALEQAAAFVDVHGQVMASAGLLTHRALESKKQTAEHLTVLSQHFAHVQQMSQRAFVNRAMVMACLTVMADRMFNLNDWESVDGANASGAARCAHVHANTKTDRALISMLVRKARVLILSGQQRPARLLLRQTLARLKASPTFVKTNPQLTALAHAVATGAGVKDARVQSVVSTIETHLDVLVQASAFATLARQLEGRAWQSTRSMMWQKALEKARTSKQTQLWSTLLVEWVLSTSDGVSTGTVVGQHQPSPTAKAIPSGLNPRDRLMHDARMAIISGKKVHLPAVGPMSALDHIDIQTFWAHLAAKQMKHGLLAQKLREIASLTSGLDPKLARSPRGTLLRGYVLGLHARLLWHQGKIGDAWRAANEAVSLVAEDDSRRSVLARVDAVTLMGLGAQGTRQQMTVKRELAALTAKDRRSRHRLHEVLGWRSVALIEYDRGDIARSLVAMRQLQAMGYAISPHGQAYGCGQVQGLFGLGKTEEAFSAAALCLNTNTQPLLRSRMKLFDVLHNTSGQRAERLKALQSFASAQPTEMISASTRKRAQFIVGELTNTTQKPVDIEALKQTMTSGVGQKRIQAHLALCNAYLDPFELKAARGCLVSLGKSIKPTQTYDRLQYLTILTTYYNRRLMPQKALFVKIPKTKKPEAKHRQAGINLRHALILSALMNGQHQMARKLWQEARDLAQNLGDKTLLEKNKQLGKHAGFTDLKDGATR